MPPMPTRFSDDYSDEESVTRPAQDDIGASLFDMRSPSIQYKDEVKVNVKPPRASKNKK